MSFGFKRFCSDVIEARRTLEKEHAPPAVKAFISAALDGLQHRYGQTRVEMSAYGHLHDVENSGSFDVSDCSISVKPWKQET